MAFGKKKVSSWRKGWKLRDIFLAKLLNYYVQGNIGFNSTEKCYETRINAEL